MHYLYSINTHRPLYRILNINHKKELLRGLWVYTQTLNTKNQPLARQVAAVEQRLSQAEQDMGSSLN